MFQKFKNFRKSVRRFAAHAEKHIREATETANTAREEHSCLAFSEGNWWFCRTTTSAARQVALRGATVRVGRNYNLHVARESQWRRIPGLA